MNNRWSTRVWLEIIAMVVVCLTSFVVLRERTENNEKDIVENSVAISKLIETRVGDREDVIASREAIIAIKDDIENIQTSIKSIELKL